ncbi:MAG: hypothetical protein RIC29_17685 [Rhodospirillaceae bacterium]
MTNLETPLHKRGYGRILAIMGLTLLIGAVLVLWGWNTVAAGLLGAPEARFVHALALQAALFGLALPFTWNRRAVRDEQN